MRIVGVAMVKNEADIIEAFVRYNLRFLDGLAILENASVDGTRGILAELMREGLPVVLIDDPEVAFTKWRKMTDLLSSVVAVFQPDWVIPLDADEMVTCTTRDAFEASLAAVPPGNVGALPWKTYVPTSCDDYAEVDPLKRIRHRRAAERPQRIKVAVPRGGFTRDRLILGQGQHSVRRDGESEPLPVAPIAGVTLAHFPVRSVEQIVGKVIGGWLAYLSDPERVDGHGEFWRSMYERFLAGDPITADELPRLAVAYAWGDGSGDVVEDPVAGDPVPPLRYGAMQIGSALVKVARTAEQIARKVATAAKGVPANLGAPTTTLLDREGSRLTASPVGPLSYDVPPFRYVFERFRPTSVLDLGCGMGTSLQRFREWGVDTVLGVKARDMGRDSLVSGALNVHDLQEALVLGRLFDLVICVEVVAHVTPEHEDVVLDSMARHASRVIVFSSVGPAQPAMSRRNLKPTSHWVKAWKARGWAALPFASLAFRMLGGYSWFQRNGLVLVPEEQASELELGCGFGTVDLCRPELDAASWPAQIRETYEQPMIGDRIKESYAAAHSRGGNSRVEQTSSRGERRLDSPRTS